MDYIHFRCIKIETPIKLRQIYLKGHQAFKHTRKTYQDEINIYLEYTHLYVIRNNNYRYTHTKHSSYRWHFMYTLVIIYIHYRERVERQYISKVWTIDEGDVYRWACRMDDKKLRQIHTAGPVAMDRKSCLYTTVQYTEICIVYWRDFLPVPTGTAEYTYLAQIPRRPFCGLIYIQLFYLYVLGTKTFF